MSSIIFLKTGELETTTPVKVVKSLVIRIHEFRKNCVGYENQRQEIQYC